MSHKGIQTRISYLQRSSLYKREKPFSADFEIGDSSIKPTNCTLVDIETDIHPIEEDNQFTLEANGFCIIKAATSLNADEALSKPQQIREAYMQEIKNILTQHFPEYARIEPLEFVVRQRHDRFPHNEAVLLSYEQPARLAHSDYTVRGAYLQLEASFPGQAAFFVGKEFDMLNVWRPLYGPNNDWPLALCDYASIEPGSDVVEADLLYQSRVSENQLLHHNESHRWHYIPNQEDHHLMVFRNIDSTGLRASKYRLYLLL